MKRILTVIGARPQFIKAAAISRAISTHFSNSLSEMIVHTGQHYDHEMSSIFFDELGIPQPYHNLHVGSGAQGAQTAAMIEGLERIIVEAKPDCVMVYGDTNSTLAGALAASKLNIPLVHVEAGLRSFNKRMPEEINRIMTDHVSTLLFASSDAAMQNLSSENFPAGNTGPYHIDNPAIFRCGDVMYDNSVYFRSIAEVRSSILKTFGLENKEYVLTTIHRNTNTDDALRLNSLFRAMVKIATENNIHIALPLHPRTARMMGELLQSEVRMAVEQCELLKILPPVSYLDMIRLEAHADMIMTDSGGVQKEAFFFKKPCIILRHETEWVELVLNGNAMIADADIEKIAQAYKHYATDPGLTWPSFYGDGHAAEFICSKIAELI